VADQYNFAAIEVGVESNEDCFVAALDSGNDAYVMLQRHRDFGSFDDGGVYVEIGDQINANYGCVDSCSVSNSQFVLRLTAPLLGCHEIRAELSIPDTQLQAFLYMLQRIFTGHESLLQIETPQ
jgi:hypothetical protein